MTEIHLCWTWKLAAPLHCGSGESRAGYADRLVHADADNRPFIPGDAVKGALRMSAEQVAGWLLNRPASYRKETDAAKGSNAPWVSEPASRPLALVFGGDATAHFSPGRVRGSSELAVFTSTAINHERGTAQEETLRMVQFVRPGADFVCEASLSVPEADAAAVTTLLAAALAATENVGAKAAIGWGAVELVEPLVKVGGAAQPMMDLVTPGRLETLRDALAVPLLLGSEVSAQPTPIDTTKLKWFRLTITPTEPVTFGRGPEVSNSATTEHAIRATTLRGACAQAWRRQAKPQEAVLGWLQAGARWSAGFPSRGNQVFVPMPASLMNPKHEKSKRLTSRSLFDDLRVDDRPDIADPNDGGAQSQWVSAGGGWMAWQGAPADLRPKTDTSMHVARDYQTGSKVTGALFSREAVRPDGQSFVAFAQMPDEARAALPEWILLGKRKSAGNGYAKLVVKEEKPSLDALGGSRFAKNGPRDADVYIQLLSPALVRDPKTGHPLRTLDVEWWRTFFDLAQDDLLSDRSPSADADSQRSDRSGRRTVATRRGGWMAPWRHGRAAVTVLDQGSVWRLRCRDVAIAELVRQRLRQRFPDGVGQLGDRQHEGFGWVAIDPAWLGVKNISLEPGDPSESEPEPTPDHARPWPGVGGLSRGELLAIVAALPSESELLDSGKELRGALHELARQAREARDQGSVGRVKEFYEARLERDRKDAWKALHHAGAFKEITWRSPDHLRFTLEGLLIRATPLKEGEA